MALDYRKFFYNSYAAFKKLDTLNPLNMPDVQDFVRHFARLIPTSKDANIIEIGCGRGDLLRWLKSEKFSNLTGIDLDPEHVRFAKEAGLENIYCAEVVDFLNNNPTKYDCLIAIDLIEHLTKDELVELFQIISRRITEDGVFIVRTPNAESPFFGSYQYGDLTHETALNRYSLGQIATACEFTSVSYYECHQRVSPKFTLKLYQFRMYLKYKVYLFSWYFIKNFILLDKNAICTKNIVACFRK